MCSEFSIGTCTQNQILLYNVTILATSWNTSICTIMVWYPSLKVSPYQKDVTYGKEERKIYFLEYIILETQCIVYL